MLKEKKIKSSLLLNIIFIFIILSYYRLPYLDESRIISNIYLLSKFASIGLFIEILSHDKKLILPNYLIYILLSELILTFVTLAMQLSVFNLMKDVLNTVSFLFMVDYFLKKYTNIFIDSVFYVLFFLVTFNLILIILYPRGIYNIGLINRSYWLFGHVNNMPEFIFSSLVISAIVYYKEKSIKKAMALILLVSSILTLFLGKSATSIVCMAFILFFTIFRKININLRNTYIFAIIFFVLIVVLNNNFRIIDNINLLFNRSVTFTGRTYIWEKTLFYIKNRPILGNGIEPTATYLFKIGFTAPHNRYLYILYRSGIVGLILFTLFILNIDRISKKFIIDKRLRNAYRITLMTCCSSLLLFEMETFGGPLIFFAFLILANFNYINDMIMERKAVEG